MLRSLHRLEKLPHTSTHTHTHGRYSLRNYFIFRHIMKSIWIFALATCVILNLLSVRSAPVVPVPLKPTTETSYAVTCNYLLCVSMKACESFLSSAHRTDQIVRRSFCFLLFLRARFIQKFRFLMKTFQDFSPYDGLQWGPNGSRSK